jgi:hypothetical protein
MGEWTPAPKVVNTLFLTDMEKRHLEGKEEGPYSGHRIHWKIGAIILCRFCNEKEAQGGTIEIRA